MPSASPPSASFRPPTTRTASQEPSDRARTEPHDQPRHPGAARRLPLRCRHRRPPDRGAHDEDGRGTSNRDTFSHGPGRTVAGATGDTAADHHGSGPVRITENGSAETDTVAADDTLTRTPKDSYRCYRDPISAHRAVRKDTR
ncbi:family 1 glycosylhydrolase [Streptomyces sp. NPDC093984]|uniref:family 1 glycosylhydrolase n=1 Tax=Streptomyces sp. NPDC093984 TaxID=3366052 RepID=UPI0038083994